MKGSPNGLDFDLEPAGGNTTMHLTALRITAAVIAALFLPSASPAAQPGLTVSTSAVASAPLQSQTASFELHIAGPGSAPLLAIPKQQRLFAASITVRNTRPGTSYNGAGADSPRRAFVVPTSSSAGYSIPDRQDPNSDVMQVSCAEGGVVTLRFWFNSWDKAHDYVDTIFVTVSPQNASANCSIEGQISYMTQ
jgi:hypothetical protein